MADIDQAYNNIFSTKNTFKNISHFFTQRKITECIDEVDPATMKRKKKDVNSTYNYLALVIPKNDTNPTLKIEIYGNNGYCFKGKIDSYTDNTPHLLIPLNDDQELFVHIYDEKEVDDSKSYISFIHVPKRYQMIEEEDVKQSTVMGATKVKELKVSL
jgi:hypothetical protein